LRFCYFEDSVSFFAQAGLDGNLPILRFPPLLVKQACHTTSRFFSVDMVSYILRTQEAIFILGIFDKICIFSCQTKKLDLLGLKT
jgi:hypothetical protein